MLSLTELMYEVEQNLQNTTTIPILVTDNGNTITWVTPTVDLTSAKIGALLGNRTPRWYALHSSSQFNIGSIDMWGEKIFIAIRDRFHDLLDLSLIKTKSLISLSIYRLSAHEKLNCFDEFLNILHDTVNSIDRLETEMRANGRKPTHKALLKRIAETNRKYKRSRR